MILDTSFIIDFLKNDESAVEKARKLKEENVPLATTTINVFELWQGASDIKNEEKKSKILKFLSSIGLLGFDFESARDGGAIYSELRQKGKLIDPEDCMIAGIAKTNNRTLLTRNLKHFQNIHGLKVESY